MFLKLHSFGEEIIVNMSKVYDFHEAENGSRLHFDTTVAPYGTYGAYDTKKGRAFRHWSKLVDELPDEILKLLAEAK
jgi:hypothetical protein